MAVTLKELASRGLDYLLARWENNELVLEPACSCGNELEEDFFCNKCGRECNCTIIACSDPQALAVAEKLVAGNPNFKNYKAVLLDK